MMIIITLSNGMHFECTKTQKFNLSNYSYKYSFKRLYCNEKNPEETKIQAVLNNSIKDWREIFKKNLNKRKEEEIRASKVITIILIIIFLKIKK